MREESTKHRRSKGGVPLPSATLTKRYRFLHEKITLSQDTRNAFIKASLLRPYDPVEALNGLDIMLGKKANDNHRRESLKWAFRVWCSSGMEIQEALQNARLQVPELSGWKPATQTTFSSSWTPLGRKLENFLVEASDTSSDCRK